ncbi:HIT family protein [Microbacteriaceae bacterium K1510]|nr:HIT family protein [Microbacteriaceae bacterium K1510]
MTETFSLHPQLAADTVPVGDLPLSRVLLAKDANYPWLILVPKRPDLTEIFDLPEREQDQLFSEIREAAGALKSITACDKLNIAAIGNVVSQLHVHVVARRKTDAAWPKPVWGAVPAIAYAPDARDRLIADLRKALPLVP